MTKVDLDFSRVAKLYPAWFRVGLLLFGAMIVVAMLWRYFSIKNELESRYLNNIHSRQSSQAMNESHVVAEVTMRYANETNQSLRLPWLIMFSALEEVKQAHSNISLLQVIPDKARAEVRLQGEAKKFAQITRFLNALKAHPRFQEVVLLNQYLVLPDSSLENNGNPIYTFSLQLKWQQ